jgi:hypothetical protein
MIKNYGFNTFVTENWLPLAEILIDSILSFSKYRITVNCINFTHDFNNDRVISKSINIDNLNFYSICMTKWASLLDNPYDICAILDSDMVATKEIDNLFYDNENRIIRAKFPLLAKHPHNPFDNPMHAQPLKHLCSVFSNKNPKMNWVYACGLVSQYHKPFISELVEHIYNFYQKGIQTYIEDEGILNALLTKYEVSDDLGYNHIPNSTLINAYINNDMKDKELYDSYLSHNCPVKFYLLHGCKNPTIAKSLLQQIKNKT